MNILGGGNGTQLNPKLMQAINQVKQIKQMSNGDFSAILKNNPMLNQMAQGLKGKNLQQFFYSQCKQMGIDPNAILQQLNS